jgi:hypothetical protein
MASERQPVGEERILRLDCREALIWLNATTDAAGSYLQFADTENQSYSSRHLVPIFTGGPMTELDSLERNIRALQQLQRVAWQQLADRTAAPQRPAISETN